MVRILPGKSLGDVYGFTGEEKGDSRICLDRFLRFGGAARIRPHSLQRLERYTYMMRLGAIWR